MAHGQRPRVGGAVEGPHAGEEAVRRDGPVDRRLDGDPGFAEVFLDDVFVRDRDVLGEVHKGWDVAMATASSFMSARKSATASGWMR